MSLAINPDFKNSDYLFAETRMYIPPRLEKFFKKWRFEDARLIWAIGGSRTYSPVQVIELWTGKRDDFAKFGTERTTISHPDLAGGEFHIDGDQVWYDSCLHQDKSSDPSKIAIPNNTIAGEAFWEEDTVYDIDMLKSQVFNYNDLVSIFNMLINDTGIDSWCYWMVSGTIKSVEADL
jgi:hypothetical protein